MYLNRVSLVESATEIDDLLGVPRKSNVARFLTVLRGVIVPHTLREHDIWCGLYFPPNFQTGREQDMGGSR